VRSLRRLLTICRLPLYRRYARFLKAPTQPYAAPIQGAGRRRTVNPLAGPGAAGEGLGR
jgi:hypothetical protein